MEPFNKQSEERWQPEENKQRIGLLNKITLGISVTALIASCAALVLALRPDAPEEIPEELETPAGMVQYRDQILPVMAGVDVNQYDLFCFGVDERGWRTYKENGLSARQGIDVSAYQGEIDWKQVADSGVEFAMIRCGYRGYGKGTINEDEQFHANMKGALDAGLDVGVYFFSQAINTWEAREEAAFVLDAIADYPVTYPVVFDWEPIAGVSSARTNGLSAEAITDCAGIFCDLVEQAGYDPAIYFNQDLGYLSYRLDVLEERDFWLAEYNQRPSFYYHFDLWQYTHKGSVPGIEGDVDLNLDFRPLSGPV